MNALKKERSSVTPLREAILRSDTNIQPPRPRAPSTLRDDLAPMPGSNSRKSSLLSLSADRDTTRRRALSSLRDELAPTSASNSVKSSSSVHRIPMSASAQFDCTTIPKPSFRANFDARNALQQRRRSKSPNTIGMMQGSIKKGPILSINSRLN